jgi:hypothetical protein
MLKDKVKPILRRSTDAYKKRPIRCVNTGIVYPSSTDAADLLSAEGILVCPSKILSVCQGKQKSTGGLRWEYAEASFEMENQSKSTT